MNFIDSQITGVILAGGKATRMDHLDKPLLKLGGKLIIEHIITNAKYQVGNLLINVNRSSEKYACFGLPVVQDCVDGYAGPLAGLLTAMRWCREHKVGTHMIASFPGDVPWFPLDTVQQLLLAVRATSSDTAWLCTDGQYQPLFSLWSMQLHDQLTAALDDGMYSPMQFILSTRNTPVLINNGPTDHFLNINTKEDLEEARTMFD